MVFWGGLKCYRTKNGVRLPATPKVKLVRLVPTLKERDLTRMLAVWEKVGLPIPKLIDANPRPSPAVSARPDQKPVPRVPAPL